MVVAVLVVVLVVVVVLVLVWWMLGECTLRGRLAARLVAGPGSGSEGGTETHFSAPWRHACSPQHAMPCPITLPVSPLPA